MVSNGQSGAPRAGARRFPRTTVIITACGVDRGLTATLDVVKRQAKRLRAEVLLVFNTWPDDIEHADRTRCEELCDLLIFEPRTGKSNALNTAVQATDAEVVAFTDDDALPTENWLEELLTPFTKESELAGVGGPVEPVFPMTGVPAWYRRLVARRHTHFLGPKHHLGNEEQEYVLPEGGSISPVPLGVSVAWRRDWLLTHPYRDELGPNRKTGLRGGEDTCVALEIMEAGGRVLYAPRALVHHTVDPSRMTLDFVQQGYACQGREYARVLHVLGRSSNDFPKLVASMQPQPLRDAWRRVGPEYRRVKRSLQIAFATSACEELAALQGSPRT